METIGTNIDVLYKKIKEYIDINFDLVKLNTIDKVADVLSSIVSRLVIFMFIAMFFLLINISLSIYLGELLGKMYLGYAIVAFFYLLMIIVINFFKDPIIKVPITNVIIAKLMKTKEKVAIINTIKEDEKSV